MARRWEKKLKRNSNRAPLFYFSVQTKPWRRRRTPHSEVHLILLNITVTTLCFFYLLLYSFTDSILITCFRFSWESVECRGPMQQKRRTVPLGMLRRFLAASIFSIVVTSFFFVHVHVSPSPTHHNFSDKIPSVCLFSLFFCSFFSQKKKKKTFLGLCIILSSSLTVFRL